METSQSKTYSELVSIPTFEERFKYLKLIGQVGAVTFGSDRYFNQIFYNDQSWRRLRSDIIIRDGGRDLAMVGNEYEIFSKIIVHHINPITLDDVIERAPKLFDPENLITCSLQTHNAIHYGDISVLPIYKIVERKPFDTCPWR